MISSLPVRLLAMTHVVMLASIYGMAQSQSSLKPASLAGTSWQLVKFQSSDDKTITPDDRTKYIIAFGNYGRAYVSNESLFGKKWGLTEIRGVALPTTKAFIELIGETKRFSGDGGCNRISGNFVLDGETLRFLQVISTRRACLDAAMQQVETDFLKALEEVFMYKLEENVLRLYLGDRLLLTFRSNSNQSDGSNEQLVTGTVTYLQRRALPPNANHRG